MLYIYVCVCVCIYIKFCVTSIFLLKAEQRASYYKQFDEQYECNVNMKGYIYKRDCIAVHLLKTTYKFIILCKCSQGSL